MKKPIRSREMDQSLKVARALIVSSQWEGCEIKGRTKLDLGRVLLITVTVPPFAKLNRPSLVGTILADSATIINVIAVAGRE